MVGEIEHQQKKLKPRCANDAKKLKPFFDTREETN